MERGEGTSEGEEERVEGEFEEMEVGEVALNVGGCREESDEGKWVGCTGS